MPAGMAEVIERVSAADWRGVEDSLREMVVFANRFWPGAGSRGFYRTNVRHGVSRVRAGTRFALGIIFHDAA